MGVAGGSRGAREGLAVAIEPAAITRRAADANNHNSVVNKRQRCAGGGPEPRDKYAPRRGTEDRIKDA